MKDRDLMEQLAKMISSAGDSLHKEGGEDGAKGSQEDQLKGFLGKPSRFEPGTFVRLNSYGKKRYKFPKQGEKAIVTDVFDNLRLDEAGNPVHGVVATYAGSQQGGKAIATFAVDLRFYEEDKKED